MVGSPILYLDLLSPSPFSSPTSSPPTSTLPSSSSFSSSSSSSSAELIYSTPSLYLGYSTTTLYSVTGIGSGLNRDSAILGGTEINDPLTGTYGPGVLSNVLVFSYNVQKTDRTDNLDYFSSSALQNSNGVTDGIFRAYEGLSFGVKPVLANLTLPLRGSKHSLGRSSNIVISNLNRPHVLYVSSNVSVLTAGETLCVMFTYSTDIIIIDSREGSSLMDSSGNVLQSIGVVMNVRLDVRTLQTTSITLNGTTSNTTSLNSIKIIYATLTKVVSNIVTFCYTILASDPSGSVEIAEILPFSFLNSSLLSTSISEKEHASLELEKNMLGMVGTIDNSLPYVLSINSPNLTAAFPFGVGDVIDIQIFLSMPVVLGNSTEIMPYLRLLLADGGNASAAYIPFVPQQPGGTTTLRFRYIVRYGDNADPLSYDSEYALEGDFRR